MGKTVVVVLLLIVAAVYGYNVYANKKLAEENVKLGETFLEQNAAKPGVESTPSGLQYKVLEAGTGTRHPTATSRVKVHYHGTLTNGRVFDSSVKRGKPLAFGLNQVIPGWTEGLQLMVEGEKARFFIPSNLAYGNRGAGAIPPGSVLIFDVELLQILD